MQLDHERLDLYQLALDWLGVDEGPATARARSGKS
jgi:hypothetical protein